MKRRTELLERWSDILERQKQHQIMDITTDLEYPLGREKYIIRPTDFKENDHELGPVTTCDCGRMLNGLRGLSIHKALWYKQRNSPIRECNPNN